MTFANKVTLCRIIIIPFFIASILYYSNENDYLRFVALSIFLIAMITDAIDGYIARRHHQKSQAGTILDPLADKLLLVSAFICLYRMRHSFAQVGGVMFPLWVVLIIVSRDAILLLGSMIIYIVHNKLNIEPTKWGKASTFFQVLCVVGILLQWQFSLILWLSAVALAIISGIGYTKNGIRVLNAAST